MKRVYTSCLKNCQTQDLESQEIGTFKKSLKTAQKHVAQCLLSSLRSIINLSFTALFYMKPKIYLQLCFCNYRYYKHAYVTSFFSSTAIIMNTLPAECFRLTYDLSGFNCRVSRHFLYLAFLYLISFSLCFPCNSMSRSCYSVLLSSEFQLKTLIKNEQFKTLKKLQILNKEIWNHLPENKLINICPEES